MVKDRSQDIEPSPEPPRVDPVPDPTAAGLDPRAPRPVYVTATAPVKLNWLEFSR
jgi:hypothetical protein